MCNLLNFSSVFEIAFALCLGYGLIKSAYRFPLIGLEKFIEDAKEVLVKFGSDHPESRLESAIGLVERSYSLRKDDLEKIYLSCSRLSVCFSVFPLLILVYAGFNENTLLSIRTVSFLIFFSLLPTPTLAFFSWIKSRQLLKKIERPRKILLHEYFEVLFISQSKATADKNITI